MNPANSDLVRRLASVPLLGHGLAEARTITAALSTGLGDNADPADLLVLCEARARLGLMRGDAGAVAELVAGEKLAEQLGDRVTALRLLLLGYRSLGEVGMLELGSELLAAIEAECAAEESLAADWRMARAACDHPDARTLWLESLALLPSPERDHDRLAALIGAANSSNAGGDIKAARQHYERALALATAYQDDVAAAEVCFFLANLLLQLGLPAEAEAPLARSVAAADQFGDTLTLVAHGSVLAALRLDAGDWDGAFRLGATVSNAAAQRRAWLGVVDGALVRATALVAMDREGDALLLLLQTARTLQSERAHAALNIVKARMGELRVQLGAERFDPALAEAAARV